MPVEKPCEVCGAPVRRPPSHMKGSHVFCGHACRAAGQRKKRTTWRRVRNDPSHPLAGKTGRVAEARAVLFDSIGWGPHPCGWCGKPVDWKVGVPGNRPDSLVADHLNSDHLDDRLENLVPSCGSCNVARTDAVGAEPHRERPNGTKLRGETRACATCGESFVAWPDKDPRRGRFCSRSCARRAPRKKVTS